MLIHQLEKDKVAHPPQWLADNTLYLTIMGSEAYGCADSGTLQSDKDLYGFCLPPRDVVFPHMGGYIHGFDKPPEFEQWQEHHCEWNNKSYDFSVYNIVRYFYLCMDANPNMLDSLYTPRECVVHTTPIAERVREKRQLFLSKKCYHRFRGYAYSQLAKSNSKERQGKRKILYDLHGFDLKFAYHVLRLCYEAEQILIEGDLDLRRHSDELKAVRRGDMTLDQVKEFFTSKEAYLEKLYQTSTLRYSPDTVAIKTLLVECLELHYGSLDKMMKVVKDEDHAETKLRKIRAILDE